MWAIVAAIVGLVLVEVWQASRLWDLREDREWDYCRIKGLRRQLQVEQEERCKLHKRLAQLETKVSKLRKAAS